MSNGELTTIKELIRDIEELRDRDIPYIAMLSANNLAFDTKNSIDKEIGGKLHITKRKLTSSVRIKKATKASPYISIDIDERSWQHRTLAHHFFGGDRDRKGIEKALIRFGYMPKDKILTPSPGVTIKPSTYVKIIAQLKLRYKAGYEANESKKTKARSISKKKERYFLVDDYGRSHLKPGVYVRMTDHDKPICILRIAKAPNYKKRLTDFEETVNKVYERRKNIHLGDAMKKVLLDNKSKGWI